MVNVALSLMLCLEFRCLFRLQSLGSGCVDGLVAFALIMEVLTLCLARFSLMECFRAWVMFWSCF